MNTERHIVYQIMNIVRNHEHNNDEPITERLMRAYLKTHRSESIRKAYKNGTSNFDECIQNVSINLENNGNEFSGKIPKIIRLTNNSGFGLSINGHSVPVVDAEQYNLSKMTMHGRTQFFAKSEGSTIVLFRPQPTKALSQDSNLLNAINSKNPMFTLSAILTDPSDDPNYDWENDVYPFPSEREQELVATVLSKVFGISMSMKPDQVQNAAADNITYHEQFNVNGGNT